MSFATPVLLVVGLLLGPLLAGRRRLLPEARPAEALVAATSVVVPARDEAVRLPRLLEALAAADPAPLEVIVVDDGSTDATADLARRAGARVLTVEPPVGWTGKAWACQQGADAAVGDLVVFLDADTEPAPSFLAAVVADAADGALVSVQPHHRVERAYERLSAGPALVTLLGAGTGVAGPRRWWRRPIAFGPAVAIRRSAYDRLGGHAAVRGAVAEDLALAAAADRSGITVRSHLGGPLLGYRMYPEGVARLVEGWSKNLATGAGSTPPLRLAACVAWVAAALQAAWLVVVADGSDLLVAGAAYGLFAGQVAVVLRRVGRFGWLTSAVYVVPLIAFIALFARSLVLTARGAPVWWRGRQVAVRS